MKRSTKWFIIALIVVVIIMLLRARAIAPAGIVSALLALPLIAERLIRWYLRYQLFRQFHRQFRQSWQQAKRGDASGAKAQSHHGLSYKEALTLLNLPPNPTKEQVKKAYIAQMKIHHPDVGGSTEMAEKINNAKDIILQNMQQKP